jgi:hypothetical protein
MKENLGNSDSNEIILSSLDSQSSHFQLDLVQENTDNNQEIILKQSSISKQSITSISITSNTSSHETSEEVPQSAGENSQSIEENLHNDEKDSQAIQGNISINHDFPFDNFEQDLRKTSHVSCDKAKSNASNENFNSINSQPDVNMTNLSSAIEDVHLTTLREAIVELRSQVQSISLNSNNQKYFQVQHQMTDQLH